MLPQDQNNLTPEQLQELATMQEWHEAGAIIIPLNGKYIDDYSQVPAADYERWKIPLGSWKGDREELYQKAVARYKSKRHWIGLVPGSVGLVCFDIDTGDHHDIADLLAQYKIPCTIVQTKRGWHIFAKADGWPSGNFTWEFAGAKGDIRFDKGYVVVWDILAIKRQLINTKSVVGAGEQIANMLKGKKQKEMFKPPAAPTTTPPTPPTDANEFGPYPPGDRDEQLFKDISRLFRIGLQEEKYRDIRTAWMNAPQQKADHAQRFEEKWKRVAYENINAKPVLDGKTEQSLATALEGLKLDYQFNVRNNEIEWKYKGREPSQRGDRLAVFIIQQIAEHYRYRNHSEQVRDLRFSTEMFNQFILALCHTRDFDDFIEWLEALPKWDGTKRVEGLLSYMFDAADDELTRWAGSYFALGPIHRAYVPGAKLDETPVLVGSKGIGKSALVRQMMPSIKRKQWTVEDFDMTLDAKEMLEKTAGAVIVEIAEMAGVGREWQKQKRYLSATTDRARLAYARHTTIAERRFVFIGTADREEVLPNDPSGIRRFIVIHLPNSCPVEEMLNDNFIEQFFAEGLVMYSDGWRPNLPRELIQTAMERNEGYQRSEETMENIVAELADNRHWTIAQICEIAELTVNKSNERKFATALLQAGWKKQRMRVNGARQTVWQKDKQKGMEI